jgi:hypothetical protein
LDLQGRKWLEAGEECIMRSFIICSHSQTLRVKLTKEEETCGEVRNLYKILVGSPEEKTPLGRNILSREDNIKMDLEGYGVTIWAGFVWLGIRPSERVINLRVP